MLTMAGNASRALRVGIALIVAGVASLAGAASLPDGVRPPAPAAGSSPSAPTGAQAAGAPSTGAPQFSDEVAVSWILVPVIVKSQKGYVSHLRREDFELRVGGRTVKFPDFEQRGEAPWSLVFLQDLSGSMGAGGRLAASQEAVRTFLDRAQPGDEFAIATFAGDTTTVDVPFTENTAAVREAVSRWDAWGRTALNDAVSWRPDISNDSRNVKRAAVLITDGVDNASRITADQARELVQRAELPVYVLGLESGDAFRLDSEGKKVYKYADVLNLLAAMTGGRYFPIQGPDDMKEACTTIAEEMRFQYVLGFDTTGQGKSEWRPLSVIVKRPNVRVVARRGYRGTPPAH
jgi:Ca-activated chloride channel family protein